MSYTVVTPGAKPRPAAVTAATAMLYVVAATQVVSMAVSVVALGPVRRVLHEELAGKPEADTVGTAITAGIVVGIVVSALFVLGTVVLGIQVGRGKNPARIVTWVLAGIGVLCYGCSLGGTAVSGALTRSIGDGNPDTGEIQSRIEAATPAWMAAVTTATSIVVLLALLAVIILLALPASNDYFRKEQEVWVPPTLPPTFPPSMPPSMPPSFPAESGGYPPAPPHMPPLPPAPPEPPQR